MSFFSVAVVVSTAGNMYSQLVNEKDVIDTSSLTITLLLVLIGLFVNEKDHFFKMFVSFVMYTTLLMESLLEHSSVHIVPSITMSIWIFVTVWEFPHKFFTRVDKDVSEDGSTSVDNISLSSSESESSMDSMDTFEHYKRIEYYEDEYFEVYSEKGVGNKVHEVKDRAKTL